MLKLIFRCGASCLYDTVQKVRLVCAMQESNLLLQSENETNTLITIGVTIALGVKDPTNIWELILVRI